MFNKYCTISDQENTRNDLHGVILGKNVDIALEEMVKDGVLQELVPGLEPLIAMKDKSNRFKPLWKHTKTVTKQSKPTIVLRWAAFFHDFGKPECFNIINDKIIFHNHESKSVKYFKKFAEKNKIFSKEEYKEICFLIYNLGYVESYTDDWTDSAVRRFITKCGPYIDNLLLLSTADITTADPNKRKSILNKINSFKNRIQYINSIDSRKQVLPKGLGHAIINAGLGNGQVISELKNFLEKEIQEEKILPNKDIEYYMNYLINKIR